MQVTLDAIETHTPHIRTFWFQAERLPHYIAGQFIELTLPQVPGDERNKRWFTLSSSPTENRLGITTKIDQGHASVYKQTLARLKPGDEVIMSEPMGDFVLPIQPKTPILYVVGGIGVTPVRSMVKWLIDTQQKREITLLYASPTPDEFIFKDILEAAGLSPHYLVTRPVTSWSGDIGKMDTEFILRHYAKDGLIYISGPEPMTERLVRELGQKEISAAKLVTDYFPGYSAI